MLKLKSLAIGILGYFICFQSCSKNENSQGPEYPKIYRYKNLMLKETEYYLRTSSNDYQKIEKPVHISNDIPEILSAIENDTAFPFKEIKLTDERLLTITTKDNDLIEDEIYKTLNGNELTLLSHTLLGFFNEVETTLTGCYPVYAFSSLGNPIAKKYFTYRCFGSKEVMVDFLVLLNTQIGDTLAVNFPLYTFEKE